MLATVIALSLIIYIKGTHGLYISWLYVLTDHNCSYPNTGVCSHSKNLHRCPHHKIIIQNVWCLYVYTSGPYSCGHYHSEMSYEHMSDTQQLRSYGYKIKMIWTTQNTVTYVLPAQRGTPHFSQHAIEYLNEQFTDRWIGRGGPHNWPLRSPDLTPLDFHVCGYIKNMAYERKVDRR
jgi:hypothetical protein